MKKVVGSLIIAIIVFCVPIFNVFAGRGCCSHHGGQAYCSNGRWVCRDGTYSPTCTCSGGYTTTRATTRTTTRKLVYGCMNSNAINYNSNANISDGSCQLEKTEVKTEKISYETKVQGATKSGNKKVIQEGIDGERKVTIRTITNEDGEEISNEIISDVITKAAVNEVIKYDEVTTTKNIVKKEIEENEKINDNEESNPYYVTLILFIINAFYGDKNKDTKLIINKIRKQKTWLRYILYLLYFIFIIPVFIDIVLVIMSYLKTKKD